VVTWKRKEKKGTIPTGAGTSYIVPRQRKLQDPHAELAYGVPKFVSSGSVSTNAETCWEPEGQ
jgi:hypothetical protein